MYRKTETLKIEPSIFDPLQKLLEHGEQVEDAGRDETLFKETVQFDDGAEMDVKVVNSESGPWTESVMFWGGGEIGCTEVGDSLDGEYTVRIEKGPRIDGEGVDLRDGTEPAVEYCVIVERGE